MKIEKKNKLSTIIILVLCVLIIGIICFVVYDKIDALHSRDISYKTRFNKFKSGICDGTHYSYKEIRINGKKVNLNLNPAPDSDKCYVASVEKYKKGNEFIVVYVETKQWGFAGAGSYDKYYILSENGDILMEIKELGDNKGIYDSSFDVKGNIITIKDYSPNFAKYDFIPVIPDVTDPTDYYLDDTYQIEYLGNNKFSEIKRIK